MLFEVTVILYFLKILSSSRNYLDNVIPVSNDIAMLNSEKEALCRRLWGRTLSTWNVDQPRHRSKDFVDKSTRLHRESA
jgi:hypothetical protein